MDKDDRDFRIILIQVYSSASAFETMYLSVIDCLSTVSMIFLLTVWHQSLTLQARFNEHIYCNIVSADIGVISKLEDYGRVI